MFISSSFSSCNRVSLRSLLRGYVVVVGGDVGGVGSFVWWTKLLSNKTMELLSSRCALLFEEQVLRVMRWFGGFGMRYSENEFWELRLFSIKILFSCEMFFCVLIWPWVVYFLGLLSTESSFPLVMFSSGFQIDVSFASSCFEKDTVSLHQEFEVCELFISIF